MGNCFGVDQPTADDKKNSENQKSVKANGMISYHPGKDRVAEFSNEEQTIFKMKVQQDRLNSRLKDMETKEKK